ncbi:hypothetical protein PF010_g26194 [Phytophthora fragariae]|uniref:Uncharacterized protein n=1 Tax=Phytophthora fragariae TaxID=53985 RepID=A0A6G0JY18_9STRA|nr:hypothetical protein PF010_g26194 [Phytophthora fragariae]
MAFLNRRFDSEDSATAIENLTAKLKKGIQAASTHFFEQEFPHDTREAILCTLDPTKTPLTPVQSGQAIRDHLEAIGRSTSKT